MSQDLKNHVIEQQDKHWIKPGMYVKHYSLPGVRITVDFVDRVKTENRGLVVGVRCHWIWNGEMKEGIFRTTELEPWVDDTL